MIEIALLAFVLTFPMATTSKLSFMIRLTDPLSRWSSRLQPDGAFARLRREACNW